THALGAGQKASTHLHTYIGGSWSRSMQRNVQNAYVIGRPLPSLASRFSSYPSCGEDPADLSHSEDIPSDFLSDCSSAVDGQVEEYGLESMDIHVRESYFETFISSPTRVCSTRSCTPDRQARTRRLSTNSVACSEVSSTSFLEDNSDAWDGSRCSSPLPSSSPPTSPMSFALSLPGDHPGIDDCDPVDPTPSLLSDSDQLSSEVARDNADEPCDHTSHDDSGLRCYAEFIQHGQDAQLLSAPLDAACSADSVRPVSVRRRSLSHGRDVSVSTISICPDELLQHVSSESERPGNQPASPRLIPFVCPHSEPQRLPLTVKVEADSSPEVLTQAEPSAKGPLAKPMLDCDTVNDVSERSSSLAVGSNDVVPAPTALEDGTIVQGAKKHARHPKLSLNHDGAGNQKQATRKARTRGKSRIAESPPSFSGADELADDRSVRSARTGVSSETAVPSPSQSRSQSPLGPAPRAPQSTSECSTEEHTEITGILVEAFATSRATSMDTAVLYLVLTRAHPELKTRYSKTEFLRLIGSVLEAGRARCGMFEMVESSGDANDEGHGRWFYVPRKDEDQERASLVSALMPRQKRSETMKYKRYYWKPLDRISRWDPEDAL
ncbi:hypothetical protein EDC04DRAFT_2701922, partial [Pisolithus marmoratus]